MRVQIPRGGAPKVGFYPNNEATLRAYNAKARDLEGGMWKLQKAREWQRRISVSVKIKEMSNIEKIKSLGFTVRSFKAAVYDYVALFDSFNIDKFINWLNE